MSGFNFPKGSEWRKWDLHVHTPASALNNQFEGTNEDEKWNNYLAKLASLTDISVLGLTDYFSIEGYKKIKTHKDNGHLSNIDFLLPNVELRILPVTSENTPINLHIMFSPEIEDRLDSKFFASLEFTYQGEVFKCIRDDLIKLGRKYENDNTLQENIAYRTGIEQFKISFDKIKEIITKDRLLQEKSLIVVSNKSEDGASGIQHSSLAATREEIYRFAHCIFSANPKDRDYFLGKGTDSSDEVIRKYGGLKPCIHGSDAHRNDKICNPDLRRFTWIKADPTFEGLKQIIYEPEERIYIGGEPSYKIERAKIIKSITISNSNRWFEDNKTIPLNEGLISIIGGKGSGKTAILDLIAYATASYKCYENDETKSKSFLKKAFKELNGLYIKVEWDDSKADEIAVADKLEEATKEGKIRYLPQDFIDQLCSEIGKSELEEQIENVIFQKIPQDSKANFAEFKSYKEAQLRVITDKKNRASKQIEEINFKIYEHKKIVESKNDKREEIKKIEDEIEKFKQEMKKISDDLGASDDQKKILDELKSSAEQKTDLEKIISGLKNNALKIEEIKNDISVFLENAKAFIDKVKINFHEIGIKEEDLKKIKVILSPENLQQILDDRKKEIEEEIKKQKCELEKLDKNIKELNSNITLEKSKQDKIEEINKSLSDLRKKKDALSDDIKKIEEAEKALPSLCNQREAIFIKYFELIFEEKEILKVAYSSLEDILKVSAEENEKLFDFLVQFNFDVNAIAEEGHELIDLRAEGRFRQTKPEALKDELEKLRFRLNLENQKISESDKESIKKFIRNVEDLFKKDGKTIPLQLKERRYTEQDFDNWLYSTKYYDISYSIKFNGIELNNLSPGLKGVALLILFLELDKEDKRPILIDQPEENLDNRSVFNTLMRYFRNAKRRRQVIIVTHNPNLVVNTDSEQIIVADFDRGLERQSSRIRYVSGSLENTFKDDSTSIILEKQGIREHVCEILEGGKEAFEKRERKYGFKTG